VGDNAAWRKVADMWWRLCKTSDESGRETFDDRFDELVKFITDTATVAEKCITNQLKWLQTLKDRKRRGQHATLGNTVLVAFTLPNEQRPYIPP